MPTQSTAVTASILMATPACCCRGDNLLRLAAQQLQGGLEGALIRGAEATAQVDRARENQALALVADLPEADDVVPSDGSGAGDLLLAEVAGPAMRTFGGKKEAALHFEQVHITSLLCVTLCDRRRLRGRQVTLQI